MMSNSNESFKGLITAINTIHEANLAHLSIVPRNIVLKGRKLDQDSFLISIPDASLSFRELRESTVCYYEKFGLNFAQNFPDRKFDIISFVFLLACCCAEKPLITKDFERPLQDLSLVVILAFLSML